MQTPLIVVSSPIADPESNKSGYSPRLDYLEITRTLGGELLGYNVSDAAWYARIRQIETRLKLDIVEARAALKRAAEGRVVVSLSEKIAIPLAMLAQVMRKTLPHVVVAHKLSSGLKTHLFRTFRLQRTFTQLICVSRAQVDYAIGELGIPQSNVHFVYDKVDHHFFAPSGSRTGDYILSVGQEQRDYATLLHAVAGTGLKLVVVASSPWSTSRVQLPQHSEVEVISRIPFTQLRELYIGARLVVVPIYDVDYAAGVNALLEGMAMAKPVIVSRTKGISDYIMDGETGRSFTPGDADELREHILSLWHDPASSQRLATNARQAVEEKMNLDLYVEAVVRIVEKVGS